MNDHKLTNLKILSTERKCIKSFDVEEILKNFAICKFSCSLIPQVFTPWFSGGHLSFASGELYKADRSAPRGPFLWQYLFVWQDWTYHLAPEASQKENVNRAKRFWFDLFGFNGISTFVGYLIPNTVYTHVLNIYDLVGLGFMTYKTIVSYFMPNPLYR